MDWCRPFLAAGRGAYSGRRRMFCNRAERERESRMSRLVLMNPEEWAVRGGGGGGSWQKFCYSPSLGRWIGLRLLPPFYHPTLVANKTGRIQVARPSYTTLSPLESIHQLSLIPARFSPLHIRKKKRGTSSTPARPSFITASPVREI